MKSEQPVVYFNNCHNRDHVALFGSGAFFDLGLTGRQAAQARNLPPGQICVVAEWSLDWKRLVFDWYSFTYEALLLNELNEQDRVFFGRNFYSEELTKESAAESKRYAPLFRITGDLKSGSVFRKDIPTSRIPSGADNSLDSESAHLVSQGGAGFGDPAENKLVEAAAIQAVVKDYTERGWSIRSVERDKCGYDLVCTKGDNCEHVEVKGVRGIEPCFIITAGEVNEAKRNKSFFLVVVTSALSKSPTLTKFSGSELNRQFNMTPTQYRATLKTSARRAKLYD